LFLEKVLMCGRRNCVERDDFVFLVSSSILRQFKEGIIPKNANKNKVFFDFLRSKPLCKIY